MRSRELLEHLGEVHRVARCRGVYIYKFDLFSSFSVQRVSFESCLCDLIDLEPAAVINYINIYTEAVAVVSVALFACGSFKYDIIVLTRLRELYRTE